MNIMKIAFNKYRLDWMLKHGYTLENLIDEIQNIHDDDPSMSLQECFDDFEIFIGFNNEIWNCYPEFLNNEYQDKEYMKELLTNEEYELYKKERLI